MGTVYKILLVSCLVIGFVFARNGKNNIKMEAKKVKGDHYWVKNYSGNNDEAQLDRKRSHKRRRKIRKPVKGLR